MLVVADERAVGPMRKGVVLPVPDSPKKMAVRPSDPTFAEQCIGMMSSGGEAIVEEREDGLLHLAGIRGARDQHDALDEVAGDQGLRSNPVAIRVDHEGGEVDNREVGSEVLLARGRRA